MGREIKLRRKTRKNIFIIKYGKKYKGKSQFKLRLVFLFSIFIVTNFIYIY